MTIQLFDLALADSEVRISPWCWLVKFALLHKGVDFETVPVRFADKSDYPDPEYGKIPVLVSGDDTIVDSARIVAWLEERMPGSPLLGGDAERAACDFYQAWIGANVYRFLGPMMFVKVWEKAHADDKDYFRESRETRLGETLEEAAAAPGLIDGIEASLQTLAAPLARHKFLGGDAPNLSDYHMMSPFMWQRTVTSKPLYETPQSVEAWKERMLDLFDGYGRKAKTAE